jgi:DNA-binding CsgD family transcriptional regulator
MVKAKVVAASDRTPKKKVCSCCGQFLPTKTFTEEDLKVPLTPRQEQIIRLMSDGVSAQECADKLNISRRTVEFHKALIASKLRTVSNDELKLYAAARGLL